MSFALTSPLTGSGYGSTIRRARAGLIATLTGRRAPLTNWAILTTCLRRPFGSRRVLALIHWQAIKLWWKGVAYASPPKPPVDEVTR